MAEHKGRVDVRGGKTKIKRADVRGRAAAPPRVTAGSFGLAYGNGPVVSCCLAYPVFVGTKWQDNATYTALAADLQLFFTDLFRSNYGTVLAQYGFGAGLLGAAHFEGAPASSSLTDASVAQIVADLHASNIIPDDTATGTNSITAHAAFVFLDDTVTLSDALLGGSFCAPDLIYGYHWYNTALRPVPFYYGVISSMSDACVTGDPNMSAMTQLQRLTTVVSHEFSELVSDPQPWTGWNSPYGEIGDICEASDATIVVTYPDGTSNTWTVQTEYSLYDDENGGPSCTASSAAPAWSPAAKAAAAAAGSGRPVGAAHPNAGIARALLPLPPTHRVGGKIVRKSEDVHRYVRRIMADLPHTYVHHGIPQLLREAADVLERAAKVAKE
jgi:hypothetical protein